MKSIWNWLDGKKTTFGAVLLIVHGVPHLEQWIGIEALDVIYYLGTALGAGGILHRATKSRGAQAGQQRNRP
jgi:hypothetical protein